MQRKDWLLVTIAEGGEDGLSPVQLQKSVFLVCEMAKNTITEACYEFEPHNYGPFCRTVYADAEALEEQGLVDIDAAGRRRYARYRTTSEGDQSASGLRGALDEPVKVYLSQAVRWVKDKTFPGLIRAIYHWFPEYRENSVFRG